MVCPWPCEKLGTHLSSGVHVFLRKYQRTGGEGKGQGGNSTGRSALAQNYLVFLGFVTSCTTTKGVEAARAPSLWTARPHQWLHLGREAYLKQGRDESWAVGKGTVVCEQHQVLYCKKMFMRLFFQKYLFLKKESISTWEKKGGEAAGLLKGSSEDTDCCILCCHCTKWIPKDTGASTLLLCASVTSGK